MKAPNLFPALMRIDDALAVGGVPPLSDRWRAELCAWYESGSPLLAGRIGRGGSKSTTSVKTMLTEVVCGEWRVPPSERHWGIFVSENLAEATARLGQLEGYLAILDIPFERRGDQIVLLDLPLGFWVRPCRIGAVSGPRVVAWAIDEAAKLDVEGKNPCREIAASLRGATVTHPGARGRLLSSAWSTLDYHYETIERGNSEAQRVAIGASWDFNPTISEAQTHEIEADPRVWAREYAGIPDAAEALAFDPVAVRASLGRSIAEGYASSGLSCALDPASGGRDSWGCGQLEWVHHMGHGDPFVHVRTADGTEIVTHELDPEKQKLRPSLLNVADLFMIEGGAWQAGIRLDQIVSRIVEWARPFGTTKAYSDQRERMGMQSELYRYGITLEELVWTNQNKADAVAALARLFCDERIVIPDTDLGHRLVEQCCAFRRRYSESGIVRFEGRKDDLVSVLITHAIGSQLGLMPGSPIRHEAPGVRINVGGAGWTDDDERNRFTVF